MAKKGKQYSNSDPVSVEYHDNSPSRGELSLLLEAVHQ